MNALTPTDEQAAAVAAFGSGTDLVIEAGAGSGKTSTLRMLAEATPRSRGIYVAYNRAIANDARAGFPPNVSCATAHSLAYRAVGARYRHRLDGPRMPARQTARLLGITEPVNFGEGRLLAVEKLARIAVETVTRFCHSDADQPQAYHVPVIAGLDSHQDRATMKAAVLPLARKAWEDLASPDGVLKFGHDHYLKLWQLSGPRLPADFVLLDEAQDANPVVAAVVDGQSHAQRVLVGDRCQQLYGWRGAVDAMSRFDGKRLTLSQSFRFGPAIAGEANKWLSILCSPLTLRGFGQVPSRVEPVGRPDAVLCRTNAEAVAQVMAAHRDGRRAALVGGGKEIRRLAEAAVTLKAGLGTDHPELFAFRTWGEVQEYVEHDSTGTDLKVFVGLIDSYGPDVVIATVDRLADEHAADLVISTAHKAKGREWPAVRIATDFREPVADHDASGDGSRVADTEAMLAYVAVTRARLVLDRDGLSWVDKYLP